MTQPDTVDVPPMPPTPDATAGAVVDDDLPCFRCGYNVRGLAGDGQCPECAASVGETLRRREAMVLGGLVPLRLSEPRWVRRLALASTLLLVAGVGILATHVLSVFELRMPVAAALPIFLAPQVLLVVGVWMIGSVESTFAGRRRSWLAIVVRVAIVLWVLSMGALIYVLATGSFGDLRYPLIGNSVTTALASWALLWRMRELAGRLDRRWLRYACAVLAFLVSLVCLATCVPGAGDIEVRADSYHMMTPEPIFGCSSLLVLLPYSLTNLPRLNGAVIGFAIVALLAVAVFVVLGVLQRALFRAAKLSREAMDVAVNPLAAPDGRTAASSHP